MKAVFETGLLIPKGWVLTYASLRSERASLLAPSSTSLLGGITMTELVRSKQEILTLVVDVVSLVVTEILSATQ